MESSVLLLHLHNSLICAIWAKINLATLAMMKTEIQIKRSVALVTIDTSGSWVWVEVDEAHLMPLVAGGLAREGLVDMPWLLVHLEIVVVHWRSASMMLFNYSCESSSVMLSFHVVAHICANSNADEEDYARDAENECYHSTR